MEKNLLFFFFTSLFICLPVSFQGWSGHEVSGCKHCVPQSALMASISLTVLAETIVQQKNLSSSTASYKLTELFPLLLHLSPLFTSSSHITDRFLSRVHEKWCFYVCVCVCHVILQYQPGSHFSILLYECVCVQRQRSKTKESQLSLSQLPLLDS